MSGPIVRKYGFPNFEKIFGERDLQHGVDDATEAGEPSEAGANAEAAEAGKKGAKAKKAPKRAK